MDLLKLVFSVALLVPSISHAQQTELERQLSVALTASVAEINTNSPQLLDEETRLDSAATFKNYIIYNNTLLKYSADQLDVTLLNPLLENAVIATLCSNKGLVGFIELGVIMVYRYHGKDGGYVTELSKDMSTCK